MDEIQSIFQSLTLMHMSKDGSMVVFLMLFIQCLLLLSLCVFLGLVLVLWCNSFTVSFLVLEYLSLDSPFSFIVFMLSCGCVCSVSLPYHGLV